MINVLYALLFSLFVSVSVTPLARRFALSRRFVDRPGSRKRHAMATPLLGGLAIFVSFAVTILLGMIVFPGMSEGTIADTPLSWSSLGILVLLGGLLMTLTGLLDDILDIRPSWKLGLHTLSAVIAGVYFVFQGAQVRLFLEEGSGMAWLAAPLTILWLVGMTNSMNLLDHADGLASGIATIAAFFFSFINVLYGNYAVAFIAAAIGGATLGFLLFNFNPASIFMGDCGSNLLGFTLGMIAVLGVYTPAGSIRELAVLTPLLILAVPLVDTVLVMVYRLRSGAPLLGADRNHLAHRLMRIGLSHREAVILLYVMGGLMGTLALLLPTLEPYQAVLTFLHAVGVIGIFAFFIHKGESQT